MVDHTSLEKQVNADFARARRKATLRRLRARLRGNTTPGRLACFEEVRRQLGAAGGVRLGPKEVGSADIVGSAGRCSEFADAFLPASEGARTRWERVDRAFRRGEELPPVSLYKVGGRYFALDGNGNALYGCAGVVSGAVGDAAVPGRGRATRVVNASAIPNLPDLPKLRYGEGEPLILPTPLAMHG